MPLGPLGSGNRAHMRTKYSSGLKVIREHVKMLLEGMCATEVIKTAQIT